MKKYLMIGFAAVTFAACSNHDFETFTQAQIDKAKYDEAFVNYLGARPAANQDWGFGATTRAFTRAAAEFGWELSEGYEAEFDKSYYDAALTELPEKTNAEGKLTNYEFLSAGPFKFSVIYSNTSAPTQVGYYYYDPAQGINTRTEVIFVDNIQNMSSYIQWSYAQTWDGVDYWNVDGAGITGQNVKDVWGWESNRGASKSKMNAKVFTFNIPAGYRVGFFTINGDYQMYSNQALNADGYFYSAVVEKDDKFLVGLEDWNSVAPDADFDCNDVIMAINKTATDTPPVIVDPDEPNPSTSDFDLRIIAEDLSATQASDFDFNDVVIDIKYGETAQIVLVAAGGTLPLRVGSTNGVGGVEVHEAMLGTAAMNGNVYKMINTGYGAPAGATADPKDISSTVTMKITNPAEAKGLSIEVYKGGKCENGVWTGGTWEELPAPLGEPACKLAVDPDFKVLGERESIKQKYTKFVDWATTNNPNLSKWWK